MPWWEMVGKRIVEEDMQSQDRAEYGKSIIKRLSEALTAKFGVGYSLSALYDFKKFYVTFSDEKIFHTACGKLNWSHNRLIMSVSEQRPKHTIWQRQHNTIGV